LAIALISTVSWAFFLVRIILRASVHSSVFWCLWSKLCRCSKRT
jgi:hypothetical protein